VQSSDPSLSVLPVVHFRNMTGVSTGHGRKAFAYQSRMTADVMAQLFDPDICGRYTNLEVVNKGPWANTIANAFQSHCDDKAQVARK
jgi:hypothetical protein